MKDFEHWYLELISDDLWYNQASMHHKPETFEATARQVFVNGLADMDNFKIVPIKEHRRHVFNKVSKILPDRIKPKPKWNLPKQEKKEEEWIPLTGEAREKRLQEYLEVIQSAPMMKPVAPLTARERLENSDWRPKPNTIHEPSELEKRTAYLRCLNRVRECRRKVYLDAFPDAPEGEIIGYLQKYKDIDDPENLAPL